MSPRRTPLPLAVAIAVGLAAAVGLGVAAPAVAADPERVAGVLADRADVLGDRTGDVVSALDRLGTDTAIDLTVVLVDDFGDWEPQDWADATAVTSSLRQNDGLLAIAVDDGLARFSLDERFPVAADRLATVEAEVNDLVATQDWAGAAIEAADGLRSAWLDAHPRAREQAARGGRADDPASPPFPWPAAALGAVVLVAAGVVLARRQGAHAAPATPDAAPTGLAEAADGGDRPTLQTAVNDRAATGDDG